MGTAIAASPAELLEQHAPELVSAVQSNFGVFCGGAASYEGNDAVREPFDGIIGMLSLVGNDLWCLALCLPRQVAESIARTFVGMEIPFDSEDMGDVVGELANILAGDVAARLDAAGLKLDLGLPTVTRGASISILLPRDCASAQMRFSCPAGDFWLTTAVAPHS